ncbi:IS3 family transposase [Neobacillus sp. PS3-34]|uniref:IS3 family transposase n=1 Tax=Neobacillus sp. PS3-34 TaxID=3070678 RepID=UPI0035A6137D
MEIRQAIEEYINHYNFKRTQMKLNQRAPTEYCTRWLHSFFCCLLDRVRPKH